MDIDPRYDYQPISQADEYVKSMNVLIDDYKLSLIEKHIDIANGTTTNKYVDIKDYMRLMRKYIDDCKAFRADSCVDSVEINVTYIDKEKEMTNKFKAGDKVVRTENCYIWDIWEDEGFMRKGNTYTVKALLNTNELLVEGSDKEYSCSFFELVTPAFKNMKGMFANMKFRVNSPEQSKEIQEALFEMGYKWLSGHTEVKYVNSDWNENIVTSLDGTFKSDRAEPWLSEGVQEYTVETTKSYKLIPVVTKVNVESPKETITIDGKTYDKEAVLKRLAELETVQN